MSISRGARALVPFIRGGEEKKKTCFRVTDGRLSLRSIGTSPKGAFPRYLGNALYQGVCVCFLLLLIYFSFGGLGTRDSKTSICAVAQKRYCFFNSCLDTDILLSSRISVPKEIPTQKTGLNPDIPPCTTLHVSIHVIKAKKHERHAKHKRNPTPVLCRSVNA